MHLLVKTGYHIVGHSHKIRYKQQTEHVLDASHDGDVNGKALSDHLKVPDYLKLQIAPYLL